MRSRPKFQSEDKWLMSIRNRLEIDWATVLLPSDRAAWMARWIALSPLDIKLHVYTPYTPTKFVETLVQPQTAYAWSQIYGVARFKLPIVQTPATVSIESPNVKSLVLTPHSFLLTYEFSSTTGPVNIQVYASGTNKKAGQSLTRASLRPMCHMPQQALTGTLNFYKCWVDRYGTPDGSPIIATLGYVNANNELRPSLDLPTGHTPIEV